MNYFHERKNAYLHNTSKVTPKNNLVESSTQKDNFSPTKKDIFSAHAQIYFLSTRKKIFSLHKQKVIELFVWKKKALYCTFFFFKREQHLNTKVSRNACWYFSHMRLNSTCCTLLQYKGKNKGFTEVGRKQIRRPSKSFQKYKTERMHTIEEEAVQERMILRTNFHASPEI